jgi:hypothetical protein
VEVMKMGTFLDALGYNPEPMERHENINKCFKGWLVYRIIDFSKKVIGLNGSKDLKNIC